MKNIILTLLVLWFPFCGFAQQKPDRMLIHNTFGNFKSYLPERIDSITFATIDGRVAADVNILDVSLDKLIVEITKSPACVGYKLSCLPKVLVDRIGNEIALSNHIDNITEAVFYDDYSRGELTGIDFDPSTDYVLLTLGVDQYNTPCSVCQVPFTTPDKPLIGNPNVVISVTDVQQRSFSAHFEPNSDVKEYAVLAMEKGTLEQQFEMFGPMFGFANIGDMVKAWGAKFTSAGDFTWTDMLPATEYTIYAQSWDIADTYARLLSTDITTNTLGGNGEARVSIEPTEYKLTDWDGELLPSLFIQFTPNDQASCYRFNVILATNYKADPDGFKTELCQDPPVPMAYWFYYEPVTGEYQVDPSTEIVMIAAAKNGMGEWGPVTELYYTTPASIEGDASVKANVQKQIIPQRLPKNGTQSGLGVIPTLRKNQILLHGK